MYHKFLIFILYFNELILSSSCFSILYAKVFTTPCSGFRLPASHVIHTVGPIYDVVQNPEVLLKNAYR